MTQTPPLLSSLLTQAQEAEDLRGPLWGTIEALQAVARGLTHPREVLTLACQVAQIGRQAMRTGSGIICGLDDAAQAADDAALQHEAARELYLSERELCQSLSMFRAGHEPMARAHLLASLRALSRAVESSGNPAYLADVAGSAFALGELCAMEEPAPAPPEGPAGEGEGAVEIEGEDDAPAVTGAGVTRGTMNRRAAA